jgi:hypothetical protein
MPLKVLEKLPELTEQQLKQLEINAQKMVGSDQSTDAVSVLSAIANERLRRKEALRSQDTARADAIRLEMQGKRLFERVIAAFSEQPPRGWERDMIAALASNPGASTEELSRALGYSGSYISWFGIACHDRQAWFGTAPQKGNSPEKLIYSGFLVDFGKKQDKAGNVVSTWTLKAEAFAAFKELHFC